MKSKILGLLTAGLLAGPMAANAALVVTGYDYEIISPPPLFLSVTPPTGIGDNLFDLYSWNGTDFVDTGTDLVGGVEYVFSPTVARFGIRGIEASANLDPSNPIAFPTGLTFDGTGTVQVTQTAVIADVPVGNVPEPGTLALLGLGLAGLAATRRRKQ